MMSLRGKTPRLSSIKPTSRGYVHPSIYVDGVKKRVLLHRIIAEIYCPGFAPGLQVNHVNGKKHDNRAENLEWVTAKQNIKHTFDVLGRKPLKGEDRSDLTIEQVKEVYRLRFQERKKIKEIATLVGTTSATVSSICVGHSWKHLFKEMGLTKKRVSSYLSHEAIREIRRLADPAKRNYSKVARQFGTTASTVCLIRNGKIWKNV